jgi:hypothetical protein
VTDHLTAQFLKLFRGRGDAYGFWEGGCVRKPLNADTFARHLNGEELIGVYPLINYQAAWWVPWGCSDIDVDDLDAARNLEMAFKVKGIKAWVERTRKGYHVWVFADGLVHAATMRRAFLAAHEAIGYPAKEVNPKQESAGSGFGNYVRLPYPNVLNGQPDNRYMLDDNDQYLDFETFLQAAESSRATMTQLESIAELWKPPVRHHIMTMETNQDVRTVLRKVGPVPYVMWRDGPLEGNDRSGTLFRLSCKMRDMEIPPAEALLVLRSADQRWGKFYLRPDGESELVKIVEKTYNVTTEEITQ